MIQRTNILQHTRQVADQPLLQLSYRTRARSMRVDRGDLLPIRSGCPFNYQGVVMLKKFFYVLPVFIHIGPQKMYNTRSLLKSLLFFLSKIPSFSSNVSTRVKKYLRNALTLDTKKLTPPMWWTLYMH